LTRIYRVLRRAYAGAPFDGEGAYRYGGRWSSPGTQLSYASGHQSLAMLEYFVHLDADDPPADLVLASADVADDLPREKLKPDSLPGNWRETPAPPQLAVYGDEFVRRGRCAFLLVPSALAPSEHNWLINPLHSDFEKLRFNPLEPLIYDARMFRRERRGQTHKRK
jgi:RES domain-containing protein